MVDGANLCHAAVSLADPSRQKSHRRQASSAVACDRGECSLACHKYMPTPSCRGHPAPLFPPLSSSLCLAVVCSLCSAFARVLPSLLSMSSVAAKPAAAAPAAASKDGQVSQLLKGQTATQRQQQSVHRTHSSQQTRSGNRIVFAVTEALCSSNVSPCAPVCALAPVQASLCSVSDSAEHRTRATTTGA